MKYEEEEKEEELEKERNENGNENSENGPRFTSHSQIGHVRKTRKWPELAANFYHDSKYLQLA